MLTIEPIRQKEIEQVYREFFPARPSASEVENAGRWQGEGAAALRLRDPVQWPELQRLLQGRHPEDNRAWGVPNTPPGEERQAGWVLTFRVSPETDRLWGMWKQNRSRDSLGYQFAHTFAVHSTLARFKERLGLYARGRDSRHKRWTIWATLPARHDTQRAPRLQTRVLLLNLGLMANGQADFFTNKEILSQEAALEKYYAARLRQGLFRELGSVQTKYSLGKRWSQDAIYSQSIYGRIRNAQEPQALKRWWKQCRFAVGQGLLRIVKNATVRQRPPTANRQNAQPPPSAPPRRKDISHSH